MYKNEKKQNKCIDIQDDYWINAARINKMMSFIEESSMIRLTSF